MAGLLFLSHRIPYPPNKGDKIRSYHLLKYLSERYDIYLATFVDDAEDWQYQEQVERLCAACHFSSIDPRRARIRSLKALLTGQALTMEYYRDEGLKRWVDEIFSEGRIQRVLVFSSAMAQYVEDGSRENIRTVVDFVDIDSDKWAQYSESKSWPASWLYRREARTLFSYERRVALKSDVSVFVSKAESELFKTRVPEASGRITYISNGVDTDYFSPLRDYIDPYKDGESAIVFTGAMDYWPNVDAVSWFARDVFPEVLKHRSDAWFYIVGARPASEVLALADLPHVRVTGTVDDVRPYLCHAKVAVAPLRVARGIQNKVLEAMSMAKPVVATSMALEGISSCEGVYKSDNRQDFSSSVVELLNDDTSATNAGLLNSGTVQEHYRWDTNLEHLAGLIEDGSDFQRLAC